MGNRLLTALLLILTGIMIGALFILFEQRIMIDDRASVEVTEVRRSDRPIFTDEMLQNMDPRFLFKIVAEEIAPTVVYIETQVRVDDRRRGFRGREDGEEERGFWDRMVPERVRTVGSGVIISPDGYILTNNHVIQGAVENTIQVVLNDKRTYSGRVVGTDPTTDIAVIKIDMNNLPVITLGNSDSLSVGEWVLAFGNPFQLRSTVTAGIVSALSREVNIIDADEEMRIQSFIQTDAAINRGNSGGALVNTSGELIGVNTAIASENGNYQGYGFAVPSNLAGKVARDLIEHGEVRRAMMGVSIAGVNAARAEDLGMERIRGVEILMVSPGGAADQAGLRASDVILSVNGSEVSESNELQEKIAVLPPGDLVSLSIWREGSVIEQQVELELLENDEPVLATAEGDRQQPGSIEFETFRELGFRVMKFTSSEGEPADLIISSVRDNSHAEEQGLREGFRIRQVEGEEVEELSVLRELIFRHIDEQGSVTLGIETRDGERSTHELEQQ